jgi:hypothetical protein
MSFVTLNNDAESIIAKHLLKDTTVDKTFMSKADADLQKAIFW